MVKKINFIKVVSLILLICMVLTSLSACSKAKNTLATRPSSTDSSKFYDTSGMVVLENNNCRLELDAGTTHFTVTDLKNSVSYASVPDFECNIVSDVIEKKFVSELMLTYYDNNSKEYYMYSTEDSVKKEGHKVAKSDDAIRVTYSFGEQSQSIFAPIVLTVEDYTTISKKLSSSQNRRLRLYYTLYSSKDPTSDFEKKSKEYPILKKKDLYIINDSISELNKMDIDSYMKKAGYTLSQNEKLLKDLDIEVKKQDIPGFTVPVEYSLNDDGFSATVLYDLVTENSENYKLQAVDLLPFFAATNSSANGKIVVPDGCGALIDMNSNTPASYVSSFYGEDIPIVYGDKHIFRQNQYLPVWGFTYDNGAYLAVVESASANAKLYVETSGPSAPANTSFARFDYRAKDTEINENLATAGSAEGLYNLYSAPLLTEFPSVRYCLLNKNTDYVVMASYYREYLILRKTLKETEDKTDILLDFVCVASGKTNICGIPFENKIVLTTVSDIKQVLEKLYEAGVSNVSVRLIGSDKSGMNYSVRDNYSVYKKVGSKEEINELSTLIKNNGGKLYLDADFQTVYSDSAFDSFSEQSDVSYTLGKKLTGVGAHNIVNGEMKKEGMGYFVSPTAYESITSSFIKSIDEFANIGVAYINAGKLLGGNYSNSNFVSRDVSLNLIKEAVNAKKNSVLIGGGNGYALSNADFVTDISFNSSEYDFESISVPFWQIVMHGELNYSGSAYNNSYNRENLLLKSIETGAALHFTLIGKSDDVLIEENLYNSMSSLSVNDRIDSVISFYNEIKDFRKSIKNVNIIEHSSVSTKVYKTVYDNGAYSIVNYNSKDIVIDGVTVSANGYYMKGAD